jgi:polyhydroxyalkanoate synthesis regulator phasin
MDDETRTAFATMAESIAVGFARMDRYFELQQAQHIEFRTEVNARLDALTERVDRRRDLDQLTNRVDRVEERLDDLRR